MSNLIREKNDEIISDLKKINAEAVIEIISLKSQLLSLEQDKRKRSISNMFRSCFGLSQNDEYKDTLDGITIQRDITDKYNGMMSLVDEKIKRRDESNIEDKLQKITEIKNEHKVIQVKNLLDDDDDNNNFGIDEITLVNTKTSKISKKITKLAQQRINILEDNKVKYANVNLVKMTDDEVKCILQDCTYDNTMLQTYNFANNIAKVVDVYDGDTFWIVALMVNEQGIYQPNRWKIRLWGVDTPEMKGKTNEEKNLAIAAKKYVNETIMNKFVRVDVMEHTIQDGKLVVEKWGRLMTKVFLENGDCLSDLLISKGLAKPYSGGTKENW